MFEIFGLYIGRISDKEKITVDYMLAYKSIVIFSVNEAKPNDYI